jgi:sugar phosphate permease
MVQQTGWRYSFFFISAISFIISVFVWIFVRNGPAAGNAQRQGTSSAPHAGTGYAGIFKTPAFWTLITLFFVYGGPFSTFQGLWGYSFLIDVAKYDKIQAGNLLMIIAFGVILGGPVLGYLGDRTLSRHKGTMLSVVILLQVANWAGITFLGPSLSSLSFGIIFFLMGMSLAGTLSLVWSITRETFPSERLGTVMGIINLAPFLAAAIFQPVTGYIMDRVGKTNGIFPFSAYQQAFFLCLVSVCAAFLISLSLARRRRVAP